jgi:hypothetical protein
MLAHEETHLLRELFCFSPALTRSKSLLFNLLDIAACNYLQPRNRIKGLPPGRANCEILPCEPLIAKYSGAEWLHQPCEFHKVAFGNLDQGDRFSRGQVVRSPSK